MVLILPLPVFNVPATLTPIPVTVIVVLPAAAIVTFPFAVAMFTLLLPFARLPIKLPLVVLPVILKLVSVPTLVIVGCATLTLNTLPVNVSPVPAVYVPAPENCVKSIGSVPIVVTLDVCTQPVLSYCVPAVTNVKSPDSISGTVS